MHQYRFRALVTPNPAARKSPARDLPGRTGALRVHARLIQPFYSCDYFPAVISQDEELLRQPAGHAAVTIALADGEAEAFFAAGQCFTIWADGIVDHTIRAEGLLGYGVICGRGHRFGPAMTTTGFTERPLDRLVSTPWRLRRPPLTAIRALLFEVPAMGTSRRTVSANHVAGSGITGSPRSGAALTGGCV